MHPRLSNEDSSRNTNWPVRFSGTSDGGIDREMQAVMNNSLSRMMKKLVMMMDLIIPIMRDN